MTQTYLEVHNLCKTFTAKNGSVEALKGVSLSIGKGEIFGVIGLSGAGKSTLVRCMNLLERPDSGDVLLNGESLLKLSKEQLRLRRQKIGMIFQHFNLLEQQTVLENVCFPLEIRGIPRKERREKALELLEKVGLADKANAYPAQLSGGQKQRVAIARVLANEPEVILCDEATSALDPQTTSSILKLLEEINRNLHITIVIITHQMAVVREICTKVAILKDGEVVEKGSVEEIFNNPKSQVAKELILTDGSQQTDLKPVIQSGDRVRIVFSENSAFEPVIANMILKFHEPVNILKADTKNVGGVAKGEMILEFPGDSEKAKAMKQYLKERGLAIGEVTDSVD